MIQSIRTSHPAASSLLRNFRFDGLRLGGMERLSAGSGAGEGEGNFVTEGAAGIGHGQDGAVGDCDVFLAIDFAGEAGPSLSERLATARRRIGSDGVLLLALPNRFALRFWSGCPEPASGLLFATLAASGSGLKGGAATDRPRLYVSRSELAEALASSGLVALEWFFAVPNESGSDDSGTLISERLVAAAPTLAAELASSRPSADRLRPRLDLFPEDLVARELARSGLFGEFASHFLVAAGSSPASPGAPGATVWPRLRPPAGEIGWHFSPGRRHAVATVFELEAGGGISVAKRSGGEAAGEDYGAFTWSAPGRAPIAPGEPMRLRLQEHLVAGRRDAFLADLAGLLGAVRQRFAAGQASKSEIFKGEALDAILTNATREETGPIHLFDLEWSSTHGIGASWWILRNALACIAMRGPAFEGVANVAELYECLCRELGVVPQLEADLAHELEFATAVRSSEASDLATIFARALSQPWPVPVSLGLDTAELRATLEFAGAHQQLVADFRRLESWTVELRQANDAVVADYRRLESWAHGLATRLQQDEEAGKPS
jgi:hypothetical protein